MIDHARPVRVFRNWKRGCYSIMQDGVLRASARQVRLGDVQFLVRESGRQRMLRERRKNVHAYAVGHLLDYVHPQDTRDLGGPGPRGALYDPYRFDSFVDTETLAPLTAARIAHLDENGLSYEPARRSPAA